ncbi:MAG: hypothetical protein JW984_13920 [Deltaproteobacteria bacterium]|uniref:Uncharacterized protein n=1 Tax=Candidatus Zymogenus saltonus TaxID=2844893 RepID=A0A9D8PNS3_9DELT|nr:hypothetical protein [Candidatus Zymogenus saltonus]
MKEERRSLLALLSDIKDMKSRQIADDLVMSTSALSERRMRSLRLKDKLYCMPDEFIVEIINDIFSKARPGDIPRAIFILSVVDIFSIPNEMENQRLLKMYAHCRQRGYENTAHLFICPEPKRKPFSKYDFVEGRELEYATLGEKRSLARTRTKALLDRLLYDPNPMVVTNLLENPRLTEQDVLKMVSRRPNSEGVLTTIYKNDRWISSYNVKRSMVKNPYTPVGIALGLLLFLKLQDLRDVSIDQTLHKVVKDVARELILRKDVRKDSGEEAANGEGEE